MLQLVLAATIAASAPAVSPPSDARLVAECTAERLKRFVSSSGTNQKWPQLPALPAHLDREVGIVLSEPGLVMDGYRQVLHVEPASRSAYVLQQGGIAGNVTVYGPLPVAACPRAAL